MVVVVVVVATTAMAKGNCFEFRIETADWLYGLMLNRQLPLHSIPILVRFLVCHILAITVYANIRGTRTWPDLALLTLHMMKYWDSQINLTVSSMSFTDRLPI